MRKNIGRAILAALWLIPGCGVWATEVIEGDEGGVPYEMSAAAVAPDADVGAAPSIPRVAADEAQPEGTAFFAAGDDMADARSLALLGTEVPSATSTRLAWTPNQSFEGIFSATPVLVVNGAEAGPTLCLTAAVHGDELNGIETVRRVMYGLDPEELSGAVIGVPIVNLQGFHRGSRYLSDRRDLNRYFPGDPDGSSASRIAHSFFQQIIRHCDAIVDLHTGSFYRTNLPQLRASLDDPESAYATHAVYHAADYRGGGL